MVKPPGSFFISCSLDDSPILIRLGFPRRPESYPDCNANDRTNGDTQRDIVHRHPERGNNPRTDAKPSFLLRLATLGRLTPLDHHYCQNQTEYQRCRNYAQDH